MRSGSWLLGVLLFLSGCAHQEVAPHPYPFIELSRADQVCAGKDGTVDVHVFVTPVGAPGAKVEFLIDGKYKTELSTPEGAVDLTLANVPYGAHTVAATVEGHTAEKEFSVWACE